MYVSNSTIINNDQLAVMTSFEISRIFSKVNFKIRLFITLLYPEVCSHAKQQSDCISKLTLFRLVLSEIHISDYGA